jgi:acyl-CoA thioester hydrolase
MDEFSHEVDLDVRFRDIDANGHVNNAVFATYTEQARIRYTEEVAGVDLDAAGLVLASLELDFRVPVEWGGTVTVASRVPGIGTTSMQFEHEIRAAGEVAATAEGLMVHVDQASGDPVAIPDEWRDRVTSFERH